MASTSELRAVPAPSTLPSAGAAALDARRAWVAPLVAATVGALAGLAATWGIVATQTLQMSL